MRSPPPPVERLAPERLCHSLFFSGRLALAARPLIQTLTARGALSAQRDRNGFLLRFTQAISVSIFLETAFFDLLLRSGTTYAIADEPVNTQPEPAAS